MDNLKDAYIKEKLEKDQLISKKADDVFNNFLNNEIKITKKVKFYQKIKYTKIVPIAACFILVFLAANVYATTQGYENVFFMIKYLSSGENITVDNKDDLLSDRDIAISYEPIKITENIEIQIANLQIKDTETKLIVNVNEKKLEKNEEIVPLRYKVYNSSDKQLCNQKSIKAEKGEEKSITYTEELILNNYNKKEDILKLEIYKSNSDLITTITIDINTKSITVLGEKEALNKISEIELKQFLGKVAGDTENDEGATIGTCMDIPKISYCGGLYTVTYTYCYLGEESIFEVDINDYNIYQNTVTIKLNENEDENENNSNNNDNDYSKFQIISIDKPIIIKSSEEKEVGKVETEVVNTSTTEKDSSTDSETNTSDDNGNDTTSAENEVKIDNYASTMSWTEYWAPGLKLKYPTIFKLEEIGGYERGFRQGEIATKITGVATGINPDTKEIVESNMTIEIYEPEYNKDISEDEYTKNIAEKYGISNVQATSCVTNDGLKWNTVSKTEENVTTIIYTTYSNEWGRSIVITTNNADNYKVINILNWMIGSTKITSY